MRQARRQMLFGFSLAEVLLAIAITSFALLALIGVLPEGLRSLQNAQRNEAEARIIQHLSARYQAMPWGDLEQSSSQQITDFDINGTFLENGGRDAIYRARAEVMDGVELPNESSASPFLKRVRIRIITQTGANTSFDDPNRYRERYVTLVNLDKSPGAGGGTVPAQGGSSASPSSGGTTTNP